MHRSLVMKLLIDLHYSTRYTINTNLPHSTRHAVAIRQGHSRLQGEASIIRLPLLLNGKLRYTVPSRIQSDPMQNDSPLRWSSFPSSLSHLLANLALCFPVSCVTYGVAAIFLGGAPFHILLCIICLIIPFRQDGLSA